MLSSQEDAEDVLQEVFAASYGALLRDERPINARPWLYRIARNRCLNHLRKPKATGQDSMDIFERDNGTTTAETVHRREEFRQIVSDVGDLPETQRTALLLREIDALSYDQIAEAMDTTVPSVKSLLVRARVSLAEASEARLLTCEEVRLELGQVAEGIAKSSAPVRRHVRGCDRCKTFRGQLKSTNKALAAVYPIGPLVLLKKLGLAKLTFGGAGAASSAAAGGSSIAGGAGVAATGAATGASTVAGSMVTAGVSTLASKAAAGVAAAVIVTGAAVEVNTVKQRDAAPAAAVASAAPATAPVAPRAAAAPAPTKKAEPKKPASAAAKKPEPVAAKPVAPPATVPAVPVATDPVEEGSSTVTLPPKTVPVPAPPTGTTPAPPAADTPPVVTPPPPPAPTPPVAAPRPQPAPAPPPIP